MPTAAHRNDQIAHALRHRGGTAGTWMPREPISQQLTPATATDEPLSPFVQVACPDAGVPVLQIATDQSLDDINPVLRLRGLNDSDEETFDLHALALTPVQADLAIAWLEHALQTVDPAATEDEQVEMQDVAEIVDALMRLAARGRAARRALA